LFEGCGREIHIGPAVHGLGTKVRTKSESTWIS
jgi:hypothetical protein